MFKEIGQMFSMLKNMPQLKANIEEFQQKLGQITAEFIGVAGQREENGMQGIARQRHELMPCLAPETHGEQAIGRNVDETKRAREITRVFRDVAWRSTGETQLRPTAAGNGREDAMSRVPVKRMPLWTHDETIQGGWISPGEIGAA